MQFLKNNLHQKNRLSMIGNTTKTPAARCAAVNSAFFVPKIQQACSFLGLLGAKNRNRIFNAGGFIGLNKRPFHGNKSSRLVSVVETRPPVYFSGGQTLTKTPGGHTMPNTSQGATIRTIHAIHTQNGIIATVHTRYHQKAVIGRLFASFDQLKGFVQSQGLSLDLLGGRI